MKKKYLGALALSLCMVGSMGSVIPVSAKSVQTTEFGTFTYSLNKSGNEVQAVTKTSKTASKLITKLEVQINATGETIANVTATKTDAKSCPALGATNGTSKKLAAFSTHEARGKTSIAKYEAEIF